MTAQISQTTLPQPYYLTQAQSLRFGPDRVDIRWDGTSRARVEFESRCANTSATHTLTVTQVAAASTTFSNVIDGVTYTNFSTIVLAAGDDFLFNTLSNTATRKNEFTLPATVTTSGSVVIELTAATGWTAVSSAFQGMVASTKPTFFRYALEQQVGTNKTILTMGKIERLPPNPYAENSGATSGLATATLCIG